MVSFRLVTGNIITLDLGVNDTFYESKIKLSQVMRVPVETIKLIYKTTTLADSKKVGDLKLLPNSIIQVLTVRTTKKTTEQPQQQSNTTPIENSSNTNPEIISTNDNKVKLSRLLKKPKSRAQLPPRRGQCFASQDPPHFKQMVKALESLGFDRKMCIKALRASFYNADRAAEYLIEGSIPDEVCEDDSALRRKRDELYDSLTSDESIWNCVTDDMSKIQLTNEQQKSIYKIESMGYERGLVLQVFEACDRDEIITTSCLVSMSN